MADRSRPPRSQPGRALTDLLCAAAEGASDARLMDLELVVLLEGRRYFFEWIQALRGEPDTEEDGDAEANSPAEADQTAPAPGGVPGSPAPANPAQFLRAWSDATARAIQLLKARQALAEREGDDEGLLEDLVTLLEESPGLRLAAPEPEAVRRG